jgi:hypothetical protein
LAAERTTPYTDSGRILYYLDVNGRYDTMDRLLRFLAHADRIGALDRIVLLEEPFAEENKTPVHEAPVRITADESVHHVQDAIERIELGYGAITLKPIAKTLSVALEVARRSVPLRGSDRQSMDAGLEQEPRRAPSPFAGPQGRHPGIQRASELCPLGRHARLSSGGIRGMDTDRIRCI